MTYTTFDLRNIYCSRINTILLKELKERSNKGQNIFDFST